MATFVDCHGDLFAADAEALVNPVNTVGVMGAGVALEVKRRWPAAFSGWRQACRDGEVRVGDVYATRVDEGLGGQMLLGAGWPCWVLHLPTKTAWREPSQLAYVEAGLRGLAVVISGLGISSVAVPALGCGNGGLAWADVRPLIMDRLSGLRGVRVLVYGPHSR